MTRQNRLLLVLALNVVLLLALFIVGLTAHCLGVFAAGGDYLTDSATVVAALISAGALLAVMVVVLIESILRLVDGAAKVDGLPVLVVSAVAAVVMIGGTVILHGDTDEGRRSSRWRRGCGCSDPCDRPLLLARPSRG